MNVATISSKAIPGRKQPTALSCTSQIWLPVGSQMSLQTTGTMSENKVAQCVARIRLRACHLLHHVSNHHALAKVAGTLGSHEFCWTFALSFQHYVAFRDKMIGKMPSHGPDGLCVYPLDGPQTRLHILVASATWHLHTFAAKLSSWSTHSF